MNNIQKIIIGIGFGLGAFSFACAALFDKPEWTHTMFMVGWVIGAGGIVLPMIFTNQNGPMSMPFRIFGIGFILFAAPGIFEFFNIEIDAPWVSTLGTILAVVGILLGMFKVNEANNDS